MSTEISFRCGTGISSFVVHVRNDSRFPKTITSTVYQAWFVTTGANCWIDGIVYKSGYSGARAKCASNGNDWNIVSDPSVGTSVKRSITVYASGGSSGYDTNSIYFRVGTGVKSYKMRYANASNTGLISNSISSEIQSTVLSVRSGTNASLSTVVFEDGYKSPYQFIEYTNSAFSSVKKYFAENDGDVYSNGTRYVKLFATKSDIYWYQMHANANGGTFSGGSTLWSSAVLSVSGTGGSVSYAVSNFPTPSRPGYTFMGWGANATTTTTYGTHVNFITTATSSDNPRSVTVYAVWAKTTYTAYVKLGMGIASASVYVDGTLKSDIRDKVYHAVSVNLASTISIKSIAKETGYEVPYTVSFYASASATSPSSSFESSDSEVVYSYTGSRVYAVLSAKKITIDPFYWNNSTWDAANIKKGQPISNLTATRWNRFKAKIQELAAAEGGAYSYASVASGGTIYATEFNGVRTAITGRSGYGTLPAAQSKGDAVKAALFEGSGSLKSALNAAINHYNNS